MEKLFGIALVILLVQSAASAVPVWGQCGGIGWTGSTVCDAGSNCVKSNDWYSQCQPGSAPTTAATTGPPLPTGASDIPRGTLTQINNFGSNPNNVGMFVYLPQSLKPKPGLLTAIHYCSGTAQAFYDGTDFKSLADQYGFAVVYPDAPDSTNCFEVNTDAGLKHDAGGDSLGIANGVRYLIDQLDVDPEKVFATGYSSGGMMTNVLAGAYPDLFKAGASFAGVAYACMAGPTFFNSECDSGRRVKTAEEWGNLVRGAYPGYTGPRPKMQIWHGSQDEVVNPQNYYEALKQWRNVFNASETPTATQQNWPISGWTKTEYGPDVQGIFASGVTHFIPVQATQVVQWMGLDK